MTRIPASPECDAALVVDPMVGGRLHLPVGVHAVVKAVWSFGPRGLERAPAEPLAAPLDDLAAGLVVGSDYWVEKSMADVVVLGEACAPSGRAVHEMEVSCQIGERLKRVSVFGRRTIEWHGGRAHIGAPAPFERIPLGPRRAYGGTDTRVPLGPSASVLEALASLADHPGSYPRNPRGVGYYVLPERFDGIELPALEHPSDRLTDARIIVGAPERWYRQPLPWHLGWQEPGMFPRPLFCGIDARLPAPPEELAEVRLGILPANYRGYLLRGADATPAGDEPTDPERAAFARRFLQEASAAMSFADLRPGYPIVLTGMHPEHPHLGLSLPSPPAVEVLGGGARRPADLRITAVVLRPGEGRVAISYAARVAELPWFWRLGGAGGEVALRVDGGAVVELPPPPSAMPPRHAEDAARNGASPQGWQR